MGMIKHCILFTRRGNTVVSTPLYPTAVWQGQVDLGVQGEFDVSPGWDMPVRAPLYEVREIELPEWLSAEEWLKNCVAWKYTWYSGVDMDWPESWQRGLLPLSCDEKRIASQLLRTKAFRSQFRKSLHDQLVAWLETPAEKRRYSSPFSPRQWACLVDRWTARRLQQADVMVREWGGRTLSTEESMALVRNKAA